MQVDRAVPREEDSATADPRRWLTFAIVLAAGFMDLLDVTIVNVAVPSIQADLGAAYPQIEWIVAAYVLAFAAVLITGGRLGDLYGRKRVFLIGMTGFTIASAACGLSSGPEMLIVSRFLQGIAAGLMVPQILAILRVTFPKRERAKAIAVYSAVCGSATAVGLALGALLVELNLFDLDWRPIFLVNIPIGILTLIAGWRVMPESRSTETARLDPVGVVLVVAAILLLTYPLTEGRRLGWPAWTFVMMAASVAALLLFVRHARGRRRTVGSALVDLDLFRSLPFAFGLLSWLLFWICFGGFFLVWTLLMQVGLGWSPLRAGLTALFFAVATGVGAAISAGALAPRFGRRVLIAGGLVVTAGFAAYGWLVAQHYGPSITSWQMMIPLVAIGLGFGLVVAPTIDLLLGQVPVHEAGAGSGLLNTGQQLGMALGVALVGVVFFGRLDHDSARGIDQVTPSIRAELTELGVPAPAQSEIIAGFRACVQDRLAQIDPAEVPASCRETGTGDVSVARVLAAAGERAKSVDFTNTFQYTLAFGIAGMVLMSCGFLALPRNARLAPEAAAVAQ
ncbi:MFS transporter [Nocardia sp. CDC159]|uniref:MFS transporter n=1 Tax=Nocardia pulmonis TaxID=2951408 RepID=A0A9X2J0L6_9NOCA|nr:MULTISPECIES: MFS transporter [Nocardia]MCM6778688.1 MFS transporter [Nocardia pulmonis]MCM6791577.1 MFS transporter [Nocardia sp. CDC159]